MSKSEYYNDMDIIDTHHAIGLAGFPKELTALIWKRKKDNEFVERYMNWKKGQENG